MSKERSMPSGYEYQHRQKRAVRSRRRRRVRIPIVFWLIVATMLALGYAAWIAPRYYPRPPAPIVMR